MLSTGLDRRDDLRRQVETILASDHGGRLTKTTESADVDFKEEAGRRYGPHLEPGNPENPIAATKLADEVACMANSPGGGALILGVEDSSGLILGTNLDVDWLRQRIHRAIDVAPAIEEHFIGGQRLLAIYVAEAREPILNTGNQLRWRVGDSCQPVDRAEWWLARERSLEHDPMADRSSRTIADVTAGAMAIVRDNFGDDPTLGDVDILRRMAALRSDDHLSQAARLLLTPARTTLVDLTVLDVHGGQIVNRLEPSPRQSLLEQIMEIEAALLALNAFSATRSEGFTTPMLRQIPMSAVREAVLNGVIHRDWNSMERTEARWYTLDSTLVVRSPGGFSGGVTSENLLSNRHSRYPALADLFRTLGLVERQGLGVDRMYASMIPMGHRPPTIVEEPGPHVSCTLVGGEPIIPITHLFNDIRPVPRQRDYRVAVIVDELLHNAFVTQPMIAKALQCEIEEAGAALRATAQCTVQGEPLIVPFEGAWLLGESARELALPAREAPWHADVLTYLSTDANACALAAISWATHLGTISTGQLMRLTGTSRGTAQRVLTGLADAGHLTRQGAGRSTTYSVSP